MIRSQTTVELQSINSFKKYDFVLKRSFLRRFELYSSSGVKVSKYLLSHMMKRSARNVVKIISQVQSRIFQKN